MYLISILYSPFQIVVLSVLLGQACRAELQQRQGELAEYPDGYFPFEESPSRTPPKVRRPPYAQADVDCPGNYTSSHFYNSSSGLQFRFYEGINAPPAGVGAGAGAVQSLDWNLCGDLNKGYIPKSPLGRNVNGHSYPL